MIILDKVFFSFFFFFNHCGFLRRTASPFPQSLTRRAQWHCAQAQPHTKAGEGPEVAVGRKAEGMTYTSSRTEPELSNPVLLDHLCEHVCVQTLPGHPCLELLSPVPRLLTALCLI